MAAPSTASARSLDELEARIRYDLACTAYPDADWMPPAANGPEPPLDVLIVGAGQAGLATWFALWREGVRNTLIVDRAPAGREGVWSTFARMPTLRTPKYLTGPDYGVPSLTFRAWYDANGFQPAWGDLARIPTRLWADYLVWFQRVVGARVESGTDFLGCSGAVGGLLQATVSRGGRPGRIEARKIVLANGMDGGGAWAAPRAFVDGLPRNVWAHTADPIDPAALAGRRVAVLGAGASAFDNAAFALDSGARSVDLYFRRARLPKIDARDWLEQAGYLFAYGDLPTDLKWAAARRHLSAGAPPPEHSIALVEADPRFSLRAGCPWRAARWTGEEVEIDTAAGARRADFLVFATGAAFDLRLRPEIAPIADLIATWRDRHAPAAAAEFTEVGCYPWLGDGFQFTEKRPGEAPWLADIHLFTWSATASLGVTGSSITGMKYGLRRLVNGLVRDLYLKIADVHIAAMPWPDRLDGAPE